MPRVILGADRCALQPGTHTIGGRAAGALPLAALEWRASVATITVPVAGGGRAMIRRTTAAIVVRLDDVPLGIAPAVLDDGATIEFDGCRLTFQTDDTGTSEVAMVDRDGWDVGTPSLIAAPPQLTSAIGARLVNVRTGTSFALTDRRIVIGRDDTCDLVVDAKEVSRRHASISPVAGGYLLRDESANGTLVNDVAIGGTCLLTHGDIVSLHETHWRYDVEGQPEEVIGSRDGEVTQVLDLSRIARSLSGVAPGRRVSCALEIVRGRFAGATFEVDKAVCSIGRGRSADVRVHDESVSASHATLLRKAGVWYVVDLRSANGTFVDGSRISGERELSTGARLNVGSVEFVFRSFTDGVEEVRARPVETGWWSRLRRYFGGRTAT